MSGSRPRGDARKPRASGVNRRPAKRGRGRSAWTIGVIALLLSVVGGRLVYLQVVAAPAYAAKARAQRLRDVTIPARRGTIYDREGEPLAVSVEAKTVYANPRAIKDKKGTASAIAQTLSLRASDVEKKLTKDSGFVYVARKVDMARASALEALELEGVGFLSDSRRTYPSGEIGCQVLGFVDVDDHGQEGIEKYYNRTLAGTPGTLLAERDPYGRPIPGGVQKSVDPVNGNDVVLTIDKDIQYQAQLELKAAVKKWGASGGYIIVMNPSSGEIYAMASTPYFDPNDRAKVNMDAVRNGSLTDAYEPGSTIKSITAASVIDKGLFTPDSKLVLPPSLKIGKRTVGEAHPRGTVTWTLSEIIIHSSNIGAIKLGQALGAKGLHDYFARFGLTEKTGVDFPGEARGWLPAAKDMSAISMANIPFGQGVSMTPLQLSRAIAAIANEGELPTPHFLLSLPQEPGAELEWPVKRAISAEAAATASEMLCDVVSDGTGKNAAVPGYTVAGKTGTAQRVREGGVGYEKGSYVSSFIGYLPAEDPQVLIAVILDRPSKQIYGGAVAAPTFSKLGEFCMAHFKVPPSPREPGANDTTATPAPAGSAD